ncbi:MAG: hypothetical protein D6768_15250, partial [Chloroflexi bacterium]
GDGTDLMDQLLDTSILRVGIRVWPEASFSPPAFRGFSNAAIGGAMNGFEVDVARQLANGLGLELELVEAYPPIIAGGDWRGEWDIALASLVPAEQPPANPVAPITYSNPYGIIPTAILVPKNSAINSLAQLSGQRVGVFEHSVYQRLFTPNDTPVTVYGQPLISQIPNSVRLIVLSNVQKAIRQMGRPAKDGPAEPSPAVDAVDAIVGPAPVFEQAVSENKLPLKIVADEANLAPHPLAVAVVPQNNLKVDRLVAEINKVLARLQRQGTLSEIYLRWYGQDFSPPQP